MLHHPSRYTSREADAAGRVQYSEDEHRIWTELHARQSQAIRGCACEEFLLGLELLDLPRERVPQLDEVARALRRETGWEVTRVPALIPAEQFFGLLAQRRFPAATFVRRREEIDYLQEPDLFHELFGHAPLLTHRGFADFTQAYGQLGLAANEEERELLARLYWFTVEFGLIRKPGQELRIYGGGILSSIGETAYAVGGVPLLRPFDLLEVLRTPYRIDIMQPVYFVIEDLQQLQELTRADLRPVLREARRLGLRAPLFGQKAA